MARLWVFLIVLLMSSLACTPDAVQQTGIQQSIATAIKDIDFGEFCEGECTTVVLDTVVRQVEQAPMIYPEGADILAVLGSVVVDALGERGFTVVLDTYDREAYWLVDTAFVSFQVVSEGSLTQSSRKSDSVDFSVVVLPPGKSYRTWAISTEVVGDNWTLTDLKRVYAP